MANSERLEPVTTGLIWFRGGLRLRDNACVYHALRDNTHVACLYVLDDTYLRGADIGAARVQFLLESLHELATEIEAHGGRLIVRRTADAPTEVVGVAKAIGAGRIYANEDYLPYPIARDRATEELAGREGIRFLRYQDLVLVPPSSVLTEEERPYSVFTPFKRRWESKLATPARYEIEPLLDRLHRFDAPNRKEHVASAELPTLAEFGLSLTQQIERGGARRGYERLGEFAERGLGTYHQRRDDAHDPEGTSRLSMHLKWGTVSIRDCYRAAREMGGPGPDKWIDELAWREFYYAVAFHFPHSLTGPMLPEYRDFPWSDDAAHLEAWKAGMTGYPFVDAGMRQLNTTGWMHNRLRQVVASYLCKDLLINWQEGERYFMRMLVDGDWPSNNGGWQWVAGSGTDPRRATRIFNPTLQMERYDPQAKYVRQWVPEYGTSKYPRPIVTHEVGRANYLAAFESTAAGRAAMREQRKAEAEQVRRDGKGNDGKKSDGTGKDGPPQTKRGRANRQVELDL